MANAYYSLPSTLADDIDVYEKEVQEFLAGKLPAGILKAKRVPRGVYEQRKDGSYMVRVRIAGGTLTTTQTQELAALAIEHGNSVLHVTTRQDVQLHDVAIADTPRVMRRLMEVGLTSKGGGGNTVRNVTACPYAGICGHEHFDVTPFAHAVTEYLISLVGSYNLPRKYKVAFSGCAADCALAQVADLGFIAEARDGRAGFRVVAGGGMGNRSRVADVLLGWTPARDVIRVAEAMRRLFDKLGDRSNKNRARLRFVFERLGIDAIRERFAEEMDAAARSGVPECHVEVQPRRNPTTGADGPPPLETIGTVRCLPQLQSGYVAVPLHLPLGFISASDFRRIGAIAQQYSTEGGVRTTRSQNLLIRFVKREDVESLAEELLKLELDVLSPAALERFVACAGAATCRLGLCLARDAARACATKLDDMNIRSETLNNLDVYINGCPNACGHQPIGPVGFLGTARRRDGRLVPSYRVTIGGRCDGNGARLGTPVGEVPARALPDLLVNLVTEFEADHDRAEQFSTYANRVGESHFRTVVARHADIPSYDERPDFYRDLGAVKDFSLAGRGAGECGAGVFEVVQEDISAARKGKTPFEVLLPTARSLLITRGVDAQNADAVFREFDKHFIDTGLVAEEFRALLVQARSCSQNTQQVLSGYKKKVSDLRQRVELLYSTLDANLEFHPPEAVAPADPTPEPEESKKTAGDREVVHELDLRGVACPMNFVKTKLRLETMCTGEELTVILDDGDPIRNVPASLRSEGQQIKAIEDLGEGHWRLTVRKQQ